MKGREECILYKYSSRKISLCLKASKTFFIAVHIELELYNNGEQMNQDEEMAIKNGQNQKATLQIAEESLSMAELIWEEATS